MYINLKEEVMIQKQKNGKFRVRYDYGHNRFYRYCLKQEIKLEEKLDKLKKLKRKKLVEERIVEKELSEIRTKIKDLESNYGKPVDIKTRRSFTCRNSWQAELVEKLFKDAHDFEAKGQEIPDYLVKAIEGQKDAPYRKDFLEELGYQLSSVSGNRPEVVANFSYSMFIEQADINEEWIEYHDIQPEEVKKVAIALCSDKESIDLKGKTFIFTGSFMGFTACEDYVKALHRLAKAKKVDGIIVSGPWVKYIFLHKTAKHQKILNSVKKLTEDNIKIYAIRSNIESADLIPDLKELGITFLTKIEDENNLFLSHKFSRISSKDQLSRFRDYTVNKNLFVNTSYVAFEPVLRDDTLRYIIGSGSSSYATPTSRIWSNAYDGQRINSEKYDNIGGHLLHFDKEGHVYPSSFYFDETTKSILVNGEVFNFKIKSSKKSDIHVIISDVHEKIMDRKAFSGFLTFLKKHRARIKSVSINGDFFDNKLLCHHDEKDISSQIRNKIKHKSFLHEVAQAKIALEAIVNALGRYKKSIKLYFKMGNHEANSLNYLKKKSLTHFLDTMLNLEYLLDLKNLGFEVIDSRRPYKLGKVAIYHGHEFNRAKASRNHGRDSVSGHSHRGVIDNLGTILPTLQNPSEAEYLPYYLEPWTMGWAVLHEYKGQVSRPELILFKDDKFYDFDKFVEVDKPYSPGEFKSLTVTFDLN